MSERATYQPFSNGSEYGAWTDANCDGCAKAYDEETRRFRCPIDEALTVAYVGDGTVSGAIFRRMGRLAPDGHERGPETPCPEFEAVPLPAEPVTPNGETVLIATPDGPKAVACYARTAYFAVTQDQGTDRRPGEGWTLTHAASGRCLDRLTYHDPADALRVAEALEREPFDWSVPAPPKRTLRRMRDAVARVESMLGGGVIVGAIAPTRAVGAEARG